MAGKKIRNIPNTLRTKYYRAIYRSDAYESESVIDCACMRIIDLSVSLLDSYPDPAYILVYDTDKTKADDLTTDDVPIFPPIKIEPGEVVNWSNPTEWTPINDNLIIVASSTQALAWIPDPVISSYVRYSTKEMTYGIANNPQQEM